MEKFVLDWEMKKSTELVSPDDFILFTFGKDK